MKFDLFYELSLPRQSGRSEQQLFEETLAELQLADRLGFSTAWLVEHHCMPEYSHSSAPELFLAAASQHTQQLRLGHAVVPLPYHHPLQVAERLATLDILSRGRVNFGFGRGFAPHEFACFGIKMQDSQRMTREAFAIIRRLLTGDTVDTESDFFSLQNVRLVPTPIQAGGPPAWMAAVSPESFTLAAELGVGVLSGPFKPWFMVKEDLKRYHRAWSGDPQTADAGMTLGVLCLEDGDRARQLARQSFAWFYRQLLQQTQPVLESLHAGYEFYRRVGRFRALLKNAHRLAVLEALGLVIVGDPAHCRNKFANLQQAGVNRVLCAVGAGVLPTDIVRESMHCLAKSVLPHFTQLP